MRENTKGTRYYNKENKEEKKNKSYKEIMRLRIKGEYKEGHPLVQSRPLFKTDN